MNNTAHYQSMIRDGMLDLSDTNISDLSPLVGLTGLQSLDLSRTNVSDPAPLAGLTGLQSLYLYGTEVSGASVAELRRSLPNLKINPVYGTMDNTAWHFTGNTLSDGSPIPAIGETLVFPNKVKICRSGYHWSLKPHQALKYAPGATLHKVRFGGYVEMRDDKGVSSERTIIASIDANRLLRRFAADQALGVAHLWDMPEVVRDYLTTLDESKEDAAGIAAGDAAGDAAWDAAWAATRSATRYAAWDAAREAAMAAAWDAAMGAARDAAWGAAMGASTAAAREAAMAAAREAAMGAAWDAAWGAAWDAAMQEFDRRVYEAFE